MLDSATRPAVFLDRDGTIIVERDYLSDPDQVALERGAAIGLRRLARLGLPLVVVSNQSGVGRGYFPEAAVHAVNTRIAALLAGEGVRIAGWFHCPHAPDEACGCRKPAAGLLTRAAAELRLDCAQSVMIGDKPSDVDAAEAAGAWGLLVATGHGAELDLDAARARGVIVCADLADAAEVVLARYK